MAKQDIRETLVKMVIKDQMNDVLGGFENSLQDSLIDEMPAHHELAAAIYDQVMAADSVEGKTCMLAVKKDIRFIGSDWIKAHIEKRLIKEGY